MANVPKTSSGEALGWRVPLRSQINHYFDWDERLQTFTSACGNVVIAENGLRKKSARRCIRCTSVVKKRG